MRKMRIKAEFIIDVPLDEKGLTLGQISALTTSDGLHETAHRVSVPVMLEALAGVHCGAYTEVLEDNGDISVTILANIAKKQEAKQVKVAPAPLSKVVGGYLADLSKKQLIKSTSVEVTDTDAAMGFLTAIASKSKSDTN